MSDVWIVDMKLLARWNGKYCALRVCVCVSVRDLFQNAAQPNVDCELLLLLDILVSAELKKTKGLQLHAINTVF